MQQRPVGQLTRGHRPRRVRKALGAELADACYGRRGYRIKPLLVQDGQRGQCPHGVGKAPRAGLAAAAAAPERRHGLLLQGELGLAAHEAWTPGSFSHAVERGDQMDSVELGRVALVHPQDIRRTRAAADLVVEALPQLLQGRGALGAAAQDPGLLRTPKDNTRGRRVPVGAFLRPPRLAGAPEAPEAAPRPVIPAPRCCRRAIGCRTAARRFGGHLP
mmetsp:Transcript_40853/g.115658  ORF Transcript_40853/g.115658 Transcript_40853/m.115658 type:complete len:218 (-) Transcript_40853:8-661(-)